jgi:hypothetical protein
MALAVDSTTLAKWERAKRLTYILDSKVDAKLVTAGRLGDPEKRGIWQWKLGKVPSEIAELRQLLNDLGLVGSAGDWLTQDPSLLREGRTLDAVATRVALTKIICGDQFIDGLLTARVLDKTVQGLVRHAYSLGLNRDGWPQHFDVGSNGRVPIGLVVKSLSGRIAGRTTGGRRECPSLKCDGWLIGVHWQTGQQLHICSEGWHFDSTSREIRVVGGGEISARFVSPKPSGTPPRDRREWPTRTELLKTRAWSVYSHS